MFNSPYTRPNHIKWFFSFILSSIWDTVRLSLISTFLILSIIILLPICLNIFIPTCVSIAQHYLIDMVFRCRTIKIIMVGLSLFYRIRHGRKRSLRIKVGETNNEVISSLLASVETNNEIQTRGSKWPRKIWVIQRKCTSNQSCKEIPNWIWVLCWIFSAIVDEKRNTGVLCWTYATLEWIWTSEPWSAQIWMVH